MIPGRDGVPRVCKLRLPQRQILTCPVERLHLLEAEADAAGGPRKDVAIRGDEDED